MSDTNRRAFFKTAFAASGGLFIAASLSGQPQGKFVYGEQVNPNQLKPGMKPRFSMEAVLASIQGQTLSVIPSAAPVTIYPADDLLVWKGTESADFSELSAGDNLYLTGQVDPSGKLLATRIWSNIVNISGSVVDVSGNGFQISGSKVSTTASTTAQVWWRSDTIINENQMNSRDIRVGMSAQVIGLFAGNGVVHATRVWLHDSSGYPLGWKGEPILSPYAQVR